MSIAEKTARRSDTVTLTVIETTSTLVTGRCGHQHVLRQTWSFGATLPTGTVVGRLRYLGHYVCRNTRSVHVYERVDF